MFTADPPNHIAENSLTSVEYEIRSETQRHLSTFIELTAYKVGTECSTVLQRHS